LVFSICGQTTANTSSFSQEKVMNKQRTQHTPGPWWVDDDGCIAAGSGESYVTVAQGLAPSDDLDEITANLTLLAAAPDLLQATRCALAELEGIMPEFEPSGDRAHPGWQTIDELRAAIEKAENQRLDERP
jgi:hypothetical protein